MSLLVEARAVSRRGAPSYSSLDRLRPQKAISAKLLSAQPACLTFSALSGYNDVDCI